MRGSARREGVGDGEQRGEHQQPDDYGLPLGGGRGRFGMRRPVRL